MKSGNALAIEKEGELLNAKEELAVLKKQLVGKDPEQLQVEKDDKETEKRAWTELKSLSEEYGKAVESKTLLSKKNKADTTTQGVLEKEQKTLVTKIKNAKVSVADAETIVTLESKIKNFEAERAKLEEGEPCNLCGATEHPFVAKYKDLEASESQKVLETRKAALDQLVAAESTNTRELTQVTTEVAHDSARLAEWDTELKTLNEKASQLHLKTSIEDTELIQTQFEAVKEACEKLNSKVIQFSILRQQKEKLEESTQEIKDTVTKYKSGIAVLEETEKNITEELRAKKEETASDENEAEELQNDLNLSVSKDELTLPEADQIVSFIDALGNQVANYNTKKKTLVGVENEISELEIQLKNLQKQVLEKEGEQQTQTLESETLKGIVADLLTERTAILPLELNVDTKRDALLQARDTAKLKAEATAEQVRKLDLDKTDKTAQKSLTEKTLTDHAQELLNHTAALEKQITASDFSSKEELLHALLSMEDKAAFTKLKTALDTKAVELQTLKSKIEQENTALQKQKTFAGSEEEALEQHTAIKTAKENLIKRSGEISKQFELDNQIKDRNKSVFEEIETQDKQVQKWKDLITLLGGSKDAFNTYVQRLTLKNLIGFANLHLYKLNRRYALVMEETYKTGEELNFKLIDHYQTDETRYVDTSSGGEKFLISLSLALGLSDLASNNVNIDSLFIDEGFGTLDNNTLETVISTLETLQEQGKMIGIISHVENLKERIPTQIQVFKKSNGVSLVEIV